MAAVSEGAIARSMFFLWERMKLVVEPTGALAAAALLEGAIVRPNTRVGAIVTGGNVALSQLPHLLSLAGK
ncbi:hypothetical protein AY599_22060 [Leptolyngbya valderiana BDU 20041]|nr:hypothetical protein AY599_22060 [Leptolyngbya valderiana BDU 20041]